MAFPQQFANFFICVVV